MYCTTGKFRGIVDTKLVKKEQFSVHYKRSFGKYYLADKGLTILKNELFKLVFYDSF